MDIDLNPLDLSIVVPVYNERDSLLILHDKILTAALDLGQTFEVIYIDDGSTDGSTEVLHALREADSHVIVAVQRRNFGKSMALMVGFALARGRFIVTMDSDLQDEPSEIGRLLHKLDEGYDVVSGWKQDRQDPLSKRLPSWIANRATTIVTGVRLRDMNNGFKAYRAVCAHRLHLYGDLHRYIPILAYYAGYRIAEIPVVHHKRQFGRSKYGAGRLMRGGLDLVTVVFLNQYGRRPLHLFGGSGALMLLAGFAINLYLTIEWFTGVRPLSERPLLTLGVLLMLMGFQLITLGLIAELIVSHMQRSEDPLNTTSNIYRAVTHDTVNEQDNRA